jgi:hypothetical protein
MHTQTEGDSKMTVTLNKFTFDDNFLDVNMDYAPVTRSMARFTSSNQIVTIVQPTAGGGPVRMDNLTVSVLGSYGFGFDLYVKNTDTDHITYLYKAMFITENSVVTLIDKSNPLWLNDDNMILQAKLQSIQSNTTIYPTVSYSFTKFEK